MTLNSQLFRVGGVGQLRAFTRHEVYEVIVLEGTGTPDDPCRNVAYWVTQDGHLLVRLDPKVAVPEELEQ